MQSSSSVGGDSKNKAAATTGGAGGSLTTARRRRPKKRRPPPTGNSNHKGGATSNSSRSRNSKRSGGGSSSRENSPQLKVTLRNIGDSAKYGSVEKVAVLVRALLARVVVSPENNKIILDEDSLQLLVDGEKAATAKKEAFLAQTIVVADNSTVTDAAEANGETIKEENDGTKKLPLAPPKATTENGENSTSTTTDNIPAAANLTNNNSNISPSSTSSSNTHSTISARIVYAVPPKRTRRRGEKPGCVYLVLKSPPLVLQAPPVASTPSPADIDNNKADTKTVSSTSATPPSTTVSYSQYSQFMAQRNIMLRRVVELMSQIALEDAKTKQEFAGCTVEESLNGKTWNASNSNINVGSSSTNNNGIHNPLDGTIFNTAEYKSFVQLQQQQDEERKARPKPPPGGVTTMTTANALPVGGGPNTTAGATVAAAATDSSEQAPVAALVQHLLDVKQKQLELKSSSRRSKAVSGTKVDGKKKDSAAATSSNNRKNNHKNAGAPSATTKRSRHHQRRVKGASAPGNKVPGSGGKVAAPASAAPTPG